jgi:hypothetical protein
MKTSPALLEDLNACSDAKNWIKSNKHASLESAWLACGRGDWMLWFAAKRGVDRKKLVLIACECARLALPYAKSPMVLRCIETAEAWTRGEATIEQVREARRAAAAAAAAAADAAAAAADAAADAAAAAADAAAYAADAAAADAAAYAAAYAAAAARKKVLKQCAEIVRKHLPELP